MDSPKGLDTHLFFPKVLPQKPLLQMRQLGQVIARTTSGLNLFVQQDPATHLKNNVGMRHNRSPVHVHKIRVSKVILVGTTVNPALFDIQQPGLAIPPVLIGIAVRRSSGKAILAVRLSRLIILHIRVKGVKNGQNLRPLA
jgi:hypothetical protein